MYCVHSKDGIGKGLCALELSGKHCLFHYSKMNGKPERMAGGGRERIKKEVYRKERGKGGRMSEG